MLRILLSLALLTATHPAFAMHAYRFYSCKHGRLSLAYDGPGSNYLVGGYSHFYLHRPNGQELPFLAYETGGDDDAKIGDLVGEETVAVTFAFQTMQEVPPSLQTPHIGESCDPGEADYHHTEWPAASGTIEINGISRKASAALHLRKNQELAIRCSESEDIPIVCPAEGKWTKESLE